MNELFKLLTDLIRDLNPLLIVAPWEMAVLVRGRWSWQRGPGIWLRIPLIDKVFLLSCRRRVASFNRATFRTRDGHNLTISGAIPYHITSVGDLLMCTDMGEDTLMKLSGSLCREYAEAWDFADITSWGMARYVAQRMNVQLRGMEVLGVEFVDFAEMPVLHLAQSNTWGNTGSGGTLNLATPIGK